MKNLVYIFLFSFLAFGGTVKAQRFRRIITSYDIRLPQVYPPSLPLPQPQNLAILNPGESRPRYESVLAVYQKKISQLENQPHSIQRDTMLMGYLHDQIVLHSFLFMLSFDPANTKKVNTKILPLAQQLRKLAIQTNHSYYTWAGYIWEEYAYFTSENIVNSFELAFRRAKLCDDCPSCNQAPECYIALAQYYAEFNDTTNTDLYFRKALNSVTKNQEKVFTLREWAVVYNKQYKPQKALNVIKRLYEIDKKPFDESWILREKAVAQIQLREFDSALLTVKDALKIDKTNTQGELTTNEKIIENTIPDSYRAILAKVYLGKNEPVKAWKYADSPNFWDDLEESPDKVLYQIHKALGNSKKALQHYEQFISFKEDLESNNKKNILSILQRNYEVQKVQNVADNEKLRAENLKTTRTYLLVGLALLGIILFILWRSNRQKQLTNELLNQQKQEIDFQRSTAEQALVILKTTQTQLIQKEKMASLGELTAGIAHEIQNPLNFVNNFAEVSVDLMTELEEEQQKADRDTEFEAELLGDLKQNLQKISHHGGRASSIVKGMLEHSRTSTGERQPTDLNALADEYLRLAYQGIRAKDKSFNCELVTSFEPTPGQVEVIPQEIGRVLLNLFNNAFYAVHEKQKTAPTDYQPTLTVSTQRTESGVEVRVKDNGTGIPDSVKTKIFQPFFTTKPTGEGTGLGLSLSYDIVTKGHGGTLEVESVVGEGTTFVLSLPTHK